MLRGSLKSTTKARASGEPAARAASATRSNSGCRRAASARRTPSLASAIAQASPSPELAPVTSATFSRMRRSMPGSGHSRTALRRLLPEGERRGCSATTSAMTQTGPQIVERRTEIVFPTDVNHYGTLFGGKAVAMMDVVASIAAMRAAHKPVVTASIDRGDFVETTARVVAVGRTSITVEVELWGEIPSTGERRLSTVGKFVLVAIDREGRPTPVKPE